jgi:hypothetical protein
VSDTELRFKIETFSPETIPMERLGQYMADLGAMLGNPAAVHFVKLLKGSTNIVHRVEEPEAEEVLARVADVAKGDAEVVNLNAFKSLNRRLKEDNTSAKLLARGTKAPLLMFPGIRTVERRFIPPIIQPGSIDGQLISIGGKDASVPVRIQDDDAIYHCTTTRDEARKLAPHLFGSRLRLVGEGRWFRSDEGEWTLEHFKILSFDPLDERPLPDIVRQLRRVKNDFTTEAWDEIFEMRDDGEHLN